MAQVSLPTAAESPPLHLLQAWSPLFARLSSGESPGKPPSADACMQLWSDFLDTLLCLLKVPVWGWFFWGWFWFGDEIFRSCWRLGR